MSAVFDAAASLSRDLTADWHDDVNRRIAPADEATHGYMVTPEGKDRGYTAWELFTGPVTRTRYATRELLDHWAERPRITRAQFERDWIGQRADGLDELIMSTAWAHR